MLEKVALPDERHAGDKRRLRIDPLIANKHSVGGCNGEMLKKSEQHTGVGFFPAALAIIRANTFLFASGAADIRWPRERRRRASGV